MSSDDNTLDTMTKSPDNNKLDTVAMARKERNENGPWEVELNYGDEEDLRQHFKDCEKNRDHLNFTPVDQFDLDHLPPGYKDVALVDLVRAVSDLTVRITVKYVSEKRPEVCLVSKKPFPCYNHRRSNLARVGTGMIINVEKYPNKYRVDKVCDCQECVDSKNPKTEFGHIRIKTASHIVYDKLEGKHTTCHLFFDKGDSPENCKGVVTLSGMSCVFSEEVCDTSDMIYATHDLKLINMIEKMVALYIERLGKIIHYSKCTSPAEELVFIVSHPHGCRKHVSVGYLKKQTLETYGDICCYTTATCSGTSGALVCMVNDWGTTCNYPVHFGNSEEDNQLNFLYCARWDCYCGGPLGPRF